MSDHSNKTSLCLSENIPQNSENKPLGLYFSKALFEGLILGGAYIRRGLSTEGYLRFKIDWASLIVGSKLTIFALFYFVFEGNCPSTSPQWAYIWRGDLTEGFLHYQFGGRIFGRAYFRNFMVFLVKERTVLMLLCGSHVYVGNQTSLEQQSKHQAPK